MIAAFVSLGGALYIAYYTTIFVLEDSELQIIARSHPAFDFWSGKLYEG
jgi:hypothetical protein